MSISPAIERVHLKQGWSVTLLGGDAPLGLEGLEISAEVPGTIHTDLLEAGLIPDPYWGENERELRWLWQTSWRYRTHFLAKRASSDECINLVFGGLDTVATILLNGVEIARTKNMHRSYRFDVTRLVVEGDNELVVIFSSALEYAHQVQKEVGFRPSPYEHPYHAIRKMACSFGWDWGPDLQTAGIWKDVSLERWKTARIESVRPLARVDVVESREDSSRANARGTVEVHVTIARLNDEPLMLKVSIGSNETVVEIPPSALEALLVLKIADVELWWPRGYGRPALYEMTVELYSESHVLDCYRRRIGFRNVELEMAHEVTGAGFTFVVNGQRLFVKGANWIPDDHLMTRITKDRLRQRIQQATDAHMNLLRVWGGGVYESEEFYDLCDELGVLVWQDFPFACAAYHEGAPLLDEVVAEARENVTRLSSHPSLAIYNGSNENIWGYCDWGWKEAIGGNGTWGLQYYEEILPAIVAELDPTRPYIPSSPFSPYHSHDSVHPNDPAWGPVHEWEVWNRVDYTHYRDYVPRFCAEFGFQGPATWATLKRSLPHEAFDQEHPAWLIHQKADDGNGKLNRGFAPHLPACEDFETWHFTTSLNQARAIQFAIEHYRSWWPKCAGSIVWQLNDCWPVTSWSAIDGDGRKKLLWYALRHAYSPRLLTFQPRAVDGTHDPSGDPQLVVVNDSDEEWSDVVAFKRIALDGTICAEATTTFVVAPRDVVTLQLTSSLLHVKRPANEVLIADVGSRDQSDHRRSIWTFVEDKDLGYSPRAFTARAVSCAAGYEVTVEADGFVRDLALLADKVAPDAEVDDALVNLLPGETHTFRVISSLAVAARDFLNPTVLVSVGSLIQSEA